jgi:hypothetical protein
MPVDRERAVAITCEHRLDAIITMAAECLTDLLLLQDWDSEAKVYAVLPPGTAPPPGPAKPSSLSEGRQPQSCLPRLR